MERKTWGSLISCRDQPKTRSSLSGFSTQDIRAKIYACERKNRLPRGNVPRLCIEPSTTSVLLCAPKCIIAQSLQELWSQVACIPFQLIKFSHYFEKFSFQYLISFIYFTMSAFSSFSEISKYVQKPVTWYGRNSICACSGYACINVWIFSPEF